VASCALYTDLSNAITYNMIKPHLPPERHNVSEQGHMARVDVHAVLTHRVLDLVHDGLLKIRENTVGGESA